MAREYGELIVDLNRQSQFVENMQSRVSRIGALAYKYTTQAAKDTTIAHYDSSPIEIKDGHTVLEDPTVVINKAAFWIMNGEANKCMEVTEMHEIYELWVDLKHKGGKGSDYAHQRALKHEWLHAFRLGVQEQYMELIEHWANKKISKKYRDKFLQENIEAKGWVEKMLCALADK